MRRLFILLLSVPILFSCEAISDSFGTSYIEADRYAKINVVQHDLSDDESQISDYTATVESIGKFDICSGEKFLLLAEGNYDLVQYPQVPVYNKLTDDITITDDFLSGEKIIVNSSYRYGVASNSGQNIFYGVTSLDLSESKDLYECSVDLYKVIKDQSFNISFYGGDVSKVDTVYATLSGIAQSWNLTNNCPEGDASTIELPITASDYGSDNYSQVRLLGTDTLQSQYACITVRYKDGEFDDQIETFDITSQMEDFNNDKAATAEMITFSIEIPESLSDPDPDTDPDPEPESDPDPEPESELAEPDGSINEWEGEYEGEMYDAEEIL